MTSRNAVRNFWLAVAAAYPLAAGVLAARIITSGSWATELSPLYAVWRPQFSPWGLLALPLFAAPLFFLRRILKLPAAAFLLYAATWGTALALATNALWTGLADLPARAITIFLRDLATLGPPSDFLPVYHDLVTQLSDHGHVRPPGLFLFLWLLIKCVGNNLYVLEVVTAILSAAAAIPIYALSRRFLGREASALAALLYLLSGSFVLHGVSYDGLFGTIGAVAIYLLIVVAQRGRWPETIGAGVVLAAGVFSSFTLAYLPVLGGVLLLYYGLRERRLGRLLVRGLVILAIPAAMLVLLYLATGYDFAANFRESYRWAQTQASGGMNVFKLISGGELPEGYPAPSYRRSYWLWAPGNLFAIFFMAGLPVAVLYFWWGWRLRRRASWREPLNAAFGLALGAFLLFNFTGVTLGETERIWLYILPIITVPAAAKLEAAATEAASASLIPLTLAVVFAQVALMRLLFWIPW